MHILEWEKVILSKKLWKGSIVWTAIAFIAVNVLVARWHHYLLSEKQQNLLLNTKKYTSAVTYEIRFDLSAGADTDKYMKYIPDATKDHLVIITGMSQMYAINEAKPRDQTISEWMDDTLRPKGIRVFGLAAPNITNEEVLLLLLSLVNNPKTCPKVFIYGVCLDKFRNIDLRPEYQFLLSKNPALKKTWKDILSEFSNKYPLASEKMENTIESLPKIEEDGIEGNLRKITAEYLPVLGNAKDINAWLQLKAFTFRNWLLRIRPTSKRPMIQRRYSMNQQFTELLIDVAEKYKVELVFYIIPLNPLAENPYIPEEYEKFKLWLSELCKKNKISFSNLESIVPKDDWGEFMGGPDFKHFKGSGHKITAEVLLKEFSSIFDKL